ncbi:MAG: metal-dependent transcriptional regulator [Deltaproteobacteria bacterium]|nr:metal-dependent transcriptional regulator [Deltaproteobacteria bacterium]
MRKDSGLSENMEDYLETILDLEKINKVARTKDIADRLGIKPGSVTGALKVLMEKGFINYSPYSFITLTSKGAKLAKDIQRRHTVLRDFLTNILQVDPDTAEATACRMEHAIDPESLEKLVAFVNFIDACPKTRSDWLEHFKESLESGNSDWGDCEKCFVECENRPAK